MEFTLTIDCDNDAFDGDPGDEVSRLLKIVANRVGYGEREGILVDINGNTVGRFGLTGQPDPEVYKDQDEAERIVVNDEYLYALARHCGSDDLEEAFTRHVEVHDMDVDVDNVDYVELMNFIQEFGR